MTAAPAPGRLLIRDLAQLIQELVGHRGEVIWDASRPDGQPTRYLDVSRARDWLGFEAGTPLRVGLERTNESFREHASQLA
mgnify:CR=1 FL=1